MCPHFLTFYLHPPICRKFSNNGYFSANISRTDGKKYIPKTGNQAEAIAHVFEQIWNNFFFPVVLVDLGEVEKKSVIFSPSKTFPIDLIVLLSFSAWSETAKKGVFDPILGRKSAKVAF